MDSNQRPLAVTCVAWLFIAVGTVGVIFHSPELLHLEKDAFLIEFTELLAVFGGVFLLRGRNWARWLILAWMLFHVVISAFHPGKDLAFHIIIFAGIAWLLLRPDSSRYFRAAN